MAGRKKQPGLRFKGFSRDWEERNWEDTVDISTNMVDPKTGDYNELMHVGPGNIESFTGKILDNVHKVGNSNLISGKFHFNKGDVIYGKINPQLAKYTIAPFEGLASADSYILNTKNGISQNFLYVILQTKDFYKYSVAVSSRTGMPKINRDELNVYNYLAPNLEEQEKSGTFFIKLDNLIVLQQRKLDKLINIKKSLLEKMFPKNGAVVPEIRFKGFSEDWKERELSEIADYYDGTHQTPTYTETGVKFVSVENIKNIKLTEKYISEEDFNNQFKIKPQINDIFMTRITAGIIGDTALVTDNGNLAYYVSLALIRPKNINPIFLEKYIGGTQFKNELFKRIIHSAFPKKINLGDIGTCVVEFPINVNEQKKIGQILKTIDNLITLHQLKLEKLKNIKKACLEKMFV